MVRQLTALAPVLLVLAAAAGCVSPRPMQVDRLNDVLKESLPSATAASPVTAAKSALAAPVAALKAPLKGAPATWLATVWQTKLAQLPDPSKNGAMNPGIVGQVFLYTDLLQLPEVGGSLTIAANDATDRPAGQPAAVPNVWHFDADTLKRMVVVDERFGKCLAVFLPWPEEWRDVNRLLIQARYDQPGTYPVFAAQTTVTLDFFSPGPQVNVTQSRTANALAVPDPRLLMQQAAASRGGVRGVPAVGVQQPGANPIQQAGFQQPAVPQQPGTQQQQPAVPQQQNWPTSALPPFQPQAAQPGANGFVQPSMTAPPGGAEFKSTVRRN